MNLIFTCGGTAGHINPAIAIANMMKERYPDANILFIGATGRMEEKLVPQAGFELKCLPGSGLSRGKNLQAIKKNLYPTEEEINDAVMLFCQEMADLANAFGEEGIYTAEDAYREFSAMYGEGYLEYIMRNTEIYEKLDAYFYEACAIKFAGAKGEIPEEPKIPENFE